jgi:DNA-binding CsgD family transcriptional regulator
MVLASFALESVAPSRSLIPVLGIAEPAFPTLPSVPEEPDLETSSRSLTRMWDDLVEGRLTITGHRVDDAWAFLSLVRPSTRTRRAVPPSMAEILAGTLTGCAQKVTALDRRRMPSTISLWISRALREVGLDCCVRNAPLALAMLASARALGHGSTFPGYRIVPSCAPSSLELRMRRPDAALRDRLSLREYEVLREVIAGSSHKEIGAHRERSPRTIANQLRSVSVKLGVTGRFEWIHLAVSLSARSSMRESCVHASST